MLKQPMAGESISEPDYCSSHGVLLYVGEDGVSHCPLCGRPTPRHATPSPGAPPALPLADFCRDRIDHHALVEAAAESGLLWGSGRVVAGETRVTINFDRADYNVLFIEMAPGQPDYYVVLKEDTYWTTDLARIFRPSEETAALKRPGTRARTRAPAQARRISVEHLQVDDPGVVHLVALASPRKTPVDSAPASPETPSSAPPAREATSPTDKQPDPAVPGPLPRRRMGLLPILTVVALIASFFFGYLYYNSASNRLDRALAANNIFGPGGGVSIYREVAASPQSIEAREMAGKLRPQLEAFGEAAFTKWYMDSDPTNWTQVAAAYEVLSSIDPSASEFAARHAYAVAQLRFEEKDFQQAYQLYDSALKSKPNWVLPLNGKAKVLIRTDSPLSNGPLGVRAFEDAITADPKFVWAYKNLGEYYKQQNRWGDAVKYLSQAATLAPGRPSIMTSLNDARRRAAQEESRLRRRSRS